MINIQNILNGWKNYSFKNSEIEVKAKQRAEVCGGCKNAVTGKFYKWIKDDIKEVEGLKCNICGCPLSSKLRSESEKCPLNLW